MKPQKTNKFVSVLQRLSVFLLAAVVVAAIYIWGIPANAPSPTSQEDADTSAAIQDFLKKNTFTSTVYRPSKPQAAVPPAVPAQTYGRITTNEPVVFLTIDDGVYENAEAFYAMYKRGVNATLFLNDNAVKDHYDYFRFWQQTGSTIQNHTLSHPHLIGMPYEQQKLEICGNADALTKAYGTKATLFRAPYGETDVNTAHAVADCDTKAIVWWSVVVENGTVNYQDGNTKLRNGDIILLHFTPNLHTDLQTIFKQIDAQGLKIGLLEDWLH